MQKGKYLALALPHQLLLPPQNLTSVSTSLAHGCQRRPLHIVALSRLVNLPSHYSVPASSPRPPFTYCCSRIHPCRWTSTSICLEMPPIANLITKIQICIMTFACKVTALTSASFKHHFLDVDHPSTWSLCLLDLALLSFQPFLSISQFPSTFDFTLQIRVMLVCSGCYEVSTRLGFGLRQELRLGSLLKFYLDFGLSYDLG